SVALPTPELSNTTSDSGPDEIPSALLHEPPRNYVIAFALVMTATLLGYGALLLGSSVPMGLFVGAVIVAAGRGVVTGILTIVLSLAAMSSIFPGQISVSTATQSMYALFVVIGVLTTFVFYSLNLRNVALRDAKAKAEASNHQLREQASSLAELNSKLEE